MNILSRFRRGSCERFPAGVFISISVAIIATVTLSPRTHAQTTTGLSRETCTRIEKGASSTVTFRKSGYSREQVKSMLALQTSQTGGADNEKLEALGRIVDYVFNADFSSLETLPRRMYELCTGTSHITYYTAHLLTQQLTSGTVTFASRLNRPW